MNYDCIRCMLGQVTHCIGDEVAHDLIDSVNVHLQVRISVPGIVSGHKRRALFDIPRNIYRTFRLNGMDEYDSRERKSRTWIRFGVARCAGEGVILGQDGDVLVRR